MPVAVADFGPARAGLLTVGWRLGAGARQTAGVAERPPGSGIYTSGLAQQSIPTYLLWDSGEPEPLYAVEDVPGVLRDSAFKVVDFGPALSGLTSVGYTLDGQPRVGAVPELQPGSGIYGALVTSPVDYDGMITWDSGTTPTPLYAVDDLALAASGPVPAPTANTTVFSVNFGKAYTGLEGTIGYRLGTAWRIVAGVAELVPGSGIYGVTLSNPATPKAILWDTGGTDPVYAVQDIDVLGAGAVFRTANFGVDHAGLTTVGYRLTGHARVTPVPELVPGSGVYGTAIAPELGYTGPVIIDSGEPDPVYHESYIDIVAALQPLPTTDDRSPPDFLSALLRWLAANTVVTGLFPYTTPGGPAYRAGAPPFFQDEAPSDIDPPYGVYTYISGVPGGFNTSKAYWVKEYVRFAVYDEDPDRLAVTGATLTRQLDAICDFPLAFATGRQMTWRPTGDTYRKDPTAIARGTSRRIFQRTLSYYVQIATRRP
jgi:hypothetical protein